MNLKNMQKFKHGAGSAALIAAVLVVVLLLNAGATALYRGLLWFIDLTSEDMYSVTDASTDYLRQTFDEVNAKRQAKGEEDVKVDIIFCADPDMLTANEQMRYIYYTALNLQKEFPDTVSVTATNVWANPSAVDAYRSNSYSSIYQSNIIVASGSEFRVTNIKTYYTYDTEGEAEPWAYNGEKKFVQSIIAVTKAEAPVCGVTYNHGEPFDPNASREDQQYGELLNVIENAGYEVQFLNLETEEIPEDCRLILSFDPQTDFKTAVQSASGKSELTKLDKFLEQTYSFMVFVDADTPKLNNLEEILEEWGISFSRYDDKNGNDGNYRVVSDSALDSAGLSVIGAYEPEGMGGSITENMRDVGGSPKVVFGNSMPIRYSPSYENTFVLEDAENGTGAFSYGSYYRNNHSRSIFDIFRADKTSVAQVLKNGSVLLDDKGEPILADTRGNYKLMTVTRESRTVGEGKGYTTVNDASYVVAVGSTEFASDKILASNAYGNTDLLLETLRSIGKEVVPVGLEFKPLYDDAMTEANSSTGNVYFTKSGNTAWMIVLAVLPAACFGVAGLIVLVRRRART